MARVKLQWIENKQRREAAFRKRCATLLRKANELSTLCGVSVAAVVYAGASDAEPAATWPPAPEDAKARQIMQSFADLPESSRGSLDSEAFLREWIGKVTKKLEKLKVGNRDLEVNIVLNDFSLRRRHDLDGLSPEIAAAVMSVLKKRARAIAGVASSSQAQAAAAAEAALVVPVAEVDMDGGETAKEGYLKDVVQIIMNDVVPTKADVDRVLEEHGLDLFKPQ